MTHAPRYNLSDADKDALLTQQAEMIQRMAARIAELEALVGKPRKTSKNSSVPPSKDGFGRGRKGPKRPGRKRPPREGKTRPLTPTPDNTERRLACACGHCGADVSGDAQRLRHAYDHIDLPPIRPVVTRVELFGGRCKECGHRYRAQAPEDMVPGTPFGPGIRALMMYLHNSHHIGFERLSRLAGELFGLKISEGAIANIFHRAGAGLLLASTAIRDLLVTAKVIASDETTTRVGDATHWQWVFISDKAVLHTIAARRARNVAEDILGGHRNCSRGSLVTLV